MKQYAFPFGLCIAIAIAGYFSNATQTLGAHPFWADKTILLGTPIGLILGYYSVRLPYARAIVGLVGLTVVTFAIAHTGKTRFAASFAEDAFAGTMWFFGWHAVVICAIAALFVAAANLKCS